MPPADARCAGPAAPTDAHGTVKASAGRVGGGGCPPPADRASWVRTERCDGGAAAVRRQYGGTVHRAAAMRRRCGGGVGGDPPQHAAGVSNGRGDAHRAP